MATKKYITPASYASMHGFSKRRVYYWIAKKNMPSVRLDGRIYVDKKTPIPRVKRGRPTK